MGRHRAALVEHLDNLIPGRVGQPSAPSRKRGKLLQVHPAGPGRPLAVFPKALLVRYDYAQEDPPKAAKLEDWPAVALGTLLPGVGEGNCLHRAQ